MTDKPSSPRAVSLPPAERRLDADIDAEMRFHLEARVEQLVQAGQTREQALAEVGRRFGDFNAYRDATRTIDAEALRRNRRASFFATLQRELRRAGGSLARHRSFAVVAITTLALGVAAATTMFAVVDTVLLRPLPYDRSERLVSVLHPATVPGSGERKWGVSPGGYFHIRDHGRSFSSFGIYGSGAVTVTSGGDAELVQSAAITHTVQTVLGARATLGRLIRPEEDLPGGPQVAVLSHEFHQRRFGGDPGIIGQSITTANGALEVIGVMQPGLTLPMPGPFASNANLVGFGVDVWVPMHLDPAGPFWNNHPYVGVGRLKDNVTVDAAQRDLAALLGRFVEWMPNAYSANFIKQYNFRIESRPLRDAVLGDRLPRALWMLFAAVALVLAIATANVANLFIVRHETRRHEAAVRTALGADRRHMAAHYLAESLLVCGMAGAAALGLTAIGLRALLLFAPVNIPRLASVALQWPAVMFATGISVTLGIVLGLVPLARHGRVLEQIRDGGRGAIGSPRARWARQLLVAGQVALTLMLLSGGGMLLGSAMRLKAVTPGFDAKQVLAFDISLPATEYDSREKAIPFHRALSDRLRALPGVRSVGGGPLPLESFGTGCTVVFREGKPYGAGEQTPCVSVGNAAPGYFDALGITVQGHIPTWSDVDDRSQPAVVTRALADRLWPGEDPVGRGIGSNGPDSDRWYRVVGVIPTLHAEALDRPATEGVFYPLTGLREGQRTDAVNDMTYVLRTEHQDPRSLIASVRDVLRELNPRVPIIEPRLMDDVMSRSLAGVSLSLVLLVGAGAMGLLLSAVGLYGVVSWLVASRRTEIGVRMAMGARRSDVLRLVMGGAMRMTVIGVSVGLIGSFFSGRVLAGLLFGASVEWLPLATASALLVCIVGIASWAPATRATRIDPVDAIRAR